MAKNLANNAYELNEILKTVYEENLSTNVLGIHFGYIEGTIKEERFVIIYKQNEQLIVSVDYNSKDLLKELLPLLTLVMDLEKPLCSYDVKSIGKNESFSTIEWNLISKDERVQQLIDGNAFENGCEISNLKLYTDNTLENKNEGKQYKKIK